MGTNPHEKPAIGVKLGAEDDDFQQSAPPPRQSFLELLVDPRTLQGLMLLGGGLLVLGLIVWLWSIGVFENRLVVASCLGVANGALLLAGVAGVHFTRYQTAGKALTLLACLVMPLNLWFYDAQGLITLDQGGHLWAPALVCCVIYVVVARVLADPMFVHAIVGGITMTGMLFLADRQVGHFWEIMAPSAFLIVLGMLCIHLERAFPIGGGAFSRERFGREFFRAGHIVMGLGLVVLFVGRLSGRLYDPFLAELGWFDAPAVATQANLKLLALALALGGAYSYVYSQVVVRAHGRYLASAIFALLWGGVILLDLLAIPLTMELLVLLTSLGALATNAATLFQQDENAGESGNTAPNWFASFGESARSLGIVLNMTAVILAGMLYARARFEVFHQVMPYEFGLPFLAAMVLCGLSCWLALRADKQGDSSNSAIWNLQGLAVVSLLALVATFACLGMEFSIATLTLEMLMPLCVAGIAIIIRSPSRQYACSRAAELMATLTLIVGVGTALGLVRAVAVAQPHVWLTIFFGQAALALSLASIFSNRLAPTILAAASICAATWQLLIALGVTQHVFIMATSLVGVAALAVAATSARIREETTRLATVSLWTGRACVSYGGLAALLLSLARLLSGETEWILLAVLAVQAVASVAAAVLSKQSVWRRHFFVLVAGQVLLAVLVVNSLSVLSMFQRIELLLTVAGLFMLAVGYLGWYRESESEDDMVSFNLAMGSLLSAVPLTIGLVVQRFGDRTAEWGWVMLHEAGVLAIGLALLGVGILCRIRWSTLVGASTIAIYVVSLVCLVQLPERLQTTAVYMMVGGGLFFGGAVFLSIYRDRLLALPRRVQQGEGMFRVFKWR